MPRGGGSHTMFFFHVIFQISAEKCFLAEKVAAQLWMTLWVVICNNHVTKPVELFKECSRFCLSSWDTFFCNNFENYIQSFLARYNV